MGRNIGTTQNLRTAEQQGIINCRLLLDGKQAVWIPSSSHTLASSSSTLLLSIVLASITVHFYPKKLYLCNSQCYIIPTAFSYCCMLEQLRQNSETENVYRLPNHVVRILLARVISEKLRDVIFPQTAWVPLE